ncbi:biosynthetic arginine decarboxylase [Salinisphaera sp. Q1T1-3]|uniref:biosynthetic arginine decarboxylase n=1 Tax=Salinisphaera sp. Q1T1-3 TaxID=2321229 RepID=UPI000E74EE10|nr:biosynthetic arginine decarboxylase [Salinisphaera sp. Q1T1-3]RJS91400.1 biosynthetic arginine decarboxylase [Salinisphaera sp. Q1T1-3]
MIADTAPVTDDAGWTLDDARRLYRIATWGDGYFGLNDAGHIEMRTTDQAAGIDLDTLADEIERQGLRLPVLVRFTDILADRITRLADAFGAARAARDYGGDYTVVYPVKVNQQRSVCERLVAAGGERAGLEAGSKPELMAVLALARPGSTIVCNGYKDRAFLRLAMAGQQLGHRVFIVVEKPSELAPIAEMADALGLRPQLGLRLRLASVAAGHWQNTGGEKSKFGLTASQAVSAIETLAASGHLDCVRMLHVHMGSQVADHAALTRSMDETAHLYRSLRELGAPIDTVDVGGGLAVDYEGRGAKSFCSMNYGVADYARLVVGALARVAAAHDMPEPDIISESGRALTAHHAVLLTQVIDSETPIETAPAGLDDTRSASAQLDRATALAADAQTRFAAGEIGLAERAAVEHEVAAIYRALAALEPADADERAAVTVAREKLATKYFVNFSVFQSVPDVWALDQVFPVMPLARLDERPTERVRLCDLTCDSDGRLDRYVDDAGLDTTLPLHRLVPGESYRIGIFMVGAYQENLGDMHNLFGDTDVVNVETDASGWHLSEAQHGDRADELLEYVHFEPETLRSAYRRKLAAAGLSARDYRECETLLEAGLAGYTYLLDT